MTNTIQDIQNAENKASEIIKSAEKKASGVIMSAKEKEEKEISNLKDTLKEEWAQKTTSQKDVLAKLYKDILKKGAGEAIKVTENNKEEATKFILDNI
jgi:vacuolar-type H+-ATPase subunit H